jgi:ATP-binding cassette subfamily C (CFTR/MRP) protein 1
VLNFFATDASFIADVLGMLNNIWVAPMNLIICIVLLYMQVDWCALIGVGMFTLLGLAQTLVMGMFIRNRFQSQAISDVRTKLLQEFLDGIRILKYYAWERFALSRVNEIRQKELKTMGSSFNLRIFQEFLVMVVPVFTMLIVFVVYAKAIGELTVAKVFTVISLFKILQMPLWSFVTSLILVFQVKASTIRINKFFSISSTGTNVSEKRITRVDCFL